ncbi:hypothetical protein DL93DRAFT_2060739 [Clavulina sp. PMI_390]|nr:hypothetical protein DL93DRAFT_2060739 [Clavulina sp. PMI_390]
MLASLISLVLSSCLANAAPAPSSLAATLIKHGETLLNSDGIPANYSPPGGVGVSPNDPPPAYVTISDFDFQSINLALNQEFIELDLFHRGLAMFSADEFAEAGITAADQFLIEFMADQEVSHAELLTDMLGPRAAKPCSYQYPFTTVRQFFDFCQKLTRFGESGVYGFLPHLDSRPAANLLTLSITTEARQQMIFRQFAGAFPMPVHFETGPPQAWAWTMLSPYLKSCPSENPLIQFQIFPSLNVTNNPSSGNGTSAIYLAAISTNRTSLSYAGREVNFTWNLPGHLTGYDGRYKTASNAVQSSQFALWVAQLNATYTPLTNVNLTSRTATTYQPNNTVFPPSDFRQLYYAVPGSATNNNGVVNGTMFVALTDTDLPVTPYNLSLVNQHVVAGPAIYQAD